MADQPPRSTLANAMTIGGLKIARYLNEWVLSFHRPHDVGADRPWCATCKVSWPCTKGDEVQATLDDIEEQLDALAG